jgi:hypothetical protein
VTAALALGLVATVVSVLLISSAPAATSDFAPGYASAVLVRDGAAHKLEPVKPGGLEEGRTEELGVFLIRALMDSVDYTSDPRRGTALAMTKRVTA